MGRRKKNLPAPVKDFVALDFECLNSDRFSVCEVGAVRYENGVAVDSFHSLVCPPTKYENPYCVKIHGLTYRKVSTAPSFKEVWKKIDKMIGGLPIVAHNVPFERSCINACADVFGTPNDYTFIDTLTLSRNLDERYRYHGLHEICERMRIPLRHHHCAIDDAKACGEVYLRFAKRLEKQLIG